MTKRLRVSTGRVTLAIATVLAVVLAAGFIAVFFFGADLFGSAVQP